MLYESAKVCRIQQQVLLILSLVYGTNIVVFAEILALYQTHNAYMLPNLWQHQARIRLLSAESTADDKCIWQKQEAIVSVAESRKKTFSANLSFPL
jgi:hypothetical protein